MKKGIYQDKKTGKWYINTKINNKTCTIRGFSSKKEADNNYDYEVEKWKRTHLFINNSNLYIDIADNYIEWVRNGKAPRTAYCERTQLRTYWDIIFGNDTIQGVYNLRRLKIVYQELKNDERLNVRKKHDLVKTFLQFSNFCYLQRHISLDILDEVKIIFQPIPYTKTVANEHKVIPQSHIKALLNVIPHDHKDLVMFSLFVALGCRLSEFLGIEINAIDLVTNRINIRKQLLPSGELTSKLKTSNSYRTIPIRQELADLVNDYITNCDLMNGRLFKVSHTDFRRKLKRYEDQAKIPHYSTHDFRHTRCYEMAKKCMNMSEVVYCAKIMGHSVSMYLNVYCSHMDNSLEEKFL